MAKATNAYGIWGLDDMTKLRFKLICVIKGVSAAQVFTEMVNNEWGKVGDEAPDEQKRSLINKIVQRVLRKKREALYSDLLREKDDI